MPTKSYTSKLCKVKTADSTMCVRTFSTVQNTLNTTVTRHLSSPSLRASYFHYSHTTPECIMNNNHINNLYGLF